MSDGPTRDALVLDGDRHESALLEKGGRFQEVCGCGWRSTWTTDPSASREHSEHVAGEDLWARLTDEQREAIDSLMTQRGPRGLGGPGQGALPTTTTTRCAWSVNGRVAASLEDRGYAVRRVDPHNSRGHVAALTDRGRAIHPLSRCSASAGGRACGYCHACLRRLPQPDLGACPHCHATDWDD